MLLAHRAIMEGGRFGSEGRFGLAGSSMGRGRAVGSGVTASYGRAGGGWYQGEWAGYGDNGKKVQHFQCHTYQKFGHYADECPSTEAAQLAVTETDSGFGGTGEREAGRAGWRASGRKIFHWGGLRVLLHGEDALGGEEAQVQHRCSSKQMLQHRCSIRQVQQHRCRKKPSSSPPPLSFPSRSSWGMKLNWAPDSGATSHMCSNISAFSALCSMDPGEGFVNAYGGITMVVRGKGKVNLVLRNGGRITLKGCAVRA